MRWVYTVRGCRRDQVQKLFFGSRNRSHCQSRLTLLYRGRYLDRLPKRSLAEPDVYYVSRRSVRGARLLRSSGIKEPLELAAIPLETLQHTLDITDCRVQFLLACRRADVSLVRWLDEADMQDMAKEAGFVPDAFLQLARSTPDGERHPAFFLEVERSDKAVRTLREKFERLTAYYRSGAYERRFGTRALRVLYLLGGDYGIRPERKAVRLAELAGDAGATFARFAVLSDFVTLQGPEVFSAPIWRRPLGHGYHALSGSTDDAKGELR